MSKGQPSQSTMRHDERKGPNRVRAHRSRDTGADGAALVPRQTNHLVLTRGFPIAAFGARSAVGIEFDLLIQEGTINRQSVACDLCIITGRPESTTLRMAYQCK